MDIIISKFWKLFQAYSYVENSKKSNAGYIDLSIVNSFADYGVLPENVIGFVSDRAIL